MIPLGKIHVSTVLLPLLFIPVSRGAGEESPAPPAVDRITLKGGKTIEGSVIDITDHRVVVLSGGEGGTRSVHARGEVQAIERAATRELLDFFERKLGEYRGSAAELSKLAEFCSMKKIVPERRRVLREVIRLEPDNVQARLELGHAKLDGKWLGEEEVEAKLLENFQVQNGELVPGKTPTTVVRKVSGISPSYRILERKKLSGEERKKLEKERANRIKDAEKYLESKRKEYIGVPWENRYRIPTKNFEIHCNSTEKVAKAYAALMEEIRNHLQKMFTSKIQRTQKAPVFIYSSQEEFMSRDNLGRWAGRGLGGYYNSVTQAITTYHGTFGFTGTTLSVLCHEGTHYYQGLVLKDFNNIPMWLIEGLAVYFGDGMVFDPVKKKMSLGKVPRDRLAHIQEKMLAKRHTPVEKLVSMTRNQGFSGSHYADSWALIYFLVNSGKNGMHFLTDYWRTGLERLLTKKDFLDLSDHYFEGVKNLEAQYMEYILGLEMPSAGRVVGDWFQSEVFQFDFKAPSETWKFFEDKEDKKLLIGLIEPGGEAEVRVYFQNNDSFLEKDVYFDGYEKLARTLFKDVKHEQVKISGLDGYKLGYVSPSRKAADFTPAVERMAPATSPDPGKEKETAKTAQYDVVEFKLIQVDGLVTIVCSAPAGQGAVHASVFDKMNENFALTFTRRW